jgi:hypothetical protein
MHFLGFAATDGASLPSALVLLVPRIMSSVIYCCRIELTESLDRAVEIEQIGSSLTNVPTSTMSHEPGGSSNVSPNEAECGSVQNTDTLRLRSPAYGVITFGIRGARQSFAGVGCTGAQVHGR